MRKLFMITMLIAGIASSCKKEEILPEEKPKMPEYPWELKKQDTIVLHKWNADH